MKKLLLLTFVLFTGLLMAQTDTVTFQVDLSQYTGTFTVANVNGTFNSWCGACNPMTDADNDDIWEVSLPITSDTIEYKFTLDGWNAQENLTPGTTCVLTTGGFTNRILYKSGDTTLSVVCWESCAACGIAGPSKSQIGLPITWDDTANVDYTVIDFGGNASDLTTDPMDPTNLVLRSVKTAGAQTWAGTTLGNNNLDNAIPFAAGSTVMQAVVYSSASGIPVLLKAEDHTDPTKSVETLASTTVAGGWDTLTFDFSVQAPGTAAINFGYTYDMISIFYDFGTAGAADTFYVDFINFGVGSSGPGKSTIDLPITWDDTATVDYTVIDFGGNNSALTTDPMNASNVVLQSIKTVGAQVWAGTSLGAHLDNAIPFSAGNTVIKAVVYAPAAGIPVLLKAEDQNDPNISVETLATTTTASGWDTLTFDFTNNASGTPAIDFTKTYDKLSIFYDFGNAGAGDTFYLDYVAFEGNSVALEENEWINLTMAPNPTNGIVRLNGQLLHDSQYQIILSDMLGRTLMNYSTRNNHIAEDIDLSRFQSGTYLITVVGESGTLTKRIILQK